MTLSRRVSNLARLPAVFATAMLILQVLVVPAQTVRAQDIDPAYLAVTDEEAGKQATRSISEQGSDDQASWVRRQWERNTENQDSLTGPWTVHSSVWVARDFTTARAIYKEQADKNKNFPEAFFARGGTFPLPLPGVGTQSSGLSACFDCNIKDEIFLHHRAVVRWGVVVHVLYLYGPDLHVPADLLRWYLSAARGAHPRVRPERPRGGRRADHQRGRAPTRRCAIS